MDIRLNTPLIVPSPDFIGEFNLITSTINPEYGRNSGGVLNAIIKSGTNEFHGDAFEFYRDTFLNSRAFFQPTAPVFHQNQYGGTVGGPIWKDHTFFFLSYQGTRNREPDTYGSGETNVFTQAQRNGYFPDIANSTTASPPPNPKTPKPQNPISSCIIIYEDIFIHHTPSINFNCSCREKYSSSSVNHSYHVIIWKTPRK